MVSLHRLGRVILLLALVVPISQEIGQCSVRPAIVNYIAKREGFFKPGTLPARLHNPGSLKFHNQPGAVRGIRNFAQFSSNAIGWCALERDVRAKLRKGVPLHKGWAYL